MTDVTRPAAPLLAGAGRSPGKRRQVHVTGGRKKEREREQEKEFESARKKERKKIENERKEEKEDNLPAFFFFSWSRSVSHSFFTSLSLSRHFFANYFFVIHHPSISSSSTIFLSSTFLGYPTIADWITLLLRRTVLPRYSVLLFIGVRRFLSAYRAPLFFSSV